MRDTDKVKRGELDCTCCGRNNVVPVFLEMLNEARDISGIPFVINSGCRCKKHNREVGGSEDSSHIKGLGVDIKCKTNSAREVVLRALMYVGFTRFGIGKTYIHVDYDTSKTKHCMWLY